MDGRDAFQIVTACAVAPTIVGCAIVVVLGRDEIQVAALAIGGLLGAPIAIWSLIDGLNRRDDPRHQNPPPDAP